MTTRYKQKPENDIVHNRLAAFMGKYLPHPEKHPEKHPDEYGRGAWKKGSQ